MLLSSILALGLGIAVEGGGGCPDAEVVRARLATLLPPGVGAKAHVAHLVLAGDSLDVELLGRGGELLGSKRLSFSTESCAARAQAVAVILAAWEVQVQGIALDLPRAPPPPLPPLPTMPAAAPSTSSPVQVSQQPPRAAEAVAARPAPPAKLALEVGAGALGSVAGGQLAFGGLVTALLGPRQGLWIVVADLEGIGDHALPVDGGFAQWDRFALGVGPGLRLRWRWLAFETYAVASVSWLQLRGLGFSADQAGNDVDVSVGLGLRIAATFRKLHPWLGVRVDDWLRGERVQVSGLSGSSPLPDLEVLTGLGCDVDLH